MATLEVDLKDVEDLIDDLRTFKKSALPFAGRDALNTTVFQGRRIWIQKIEAKFVIRNRFTVRQVRVVKAKGSNVDAMESTLGSTAPYMRIQEFGGTIRGTRKSKPIPTSVAAGQAMGTRPRTKVVRRPMRQASIRLGRRVRTGSRRQRNAIAIRQAVTTGRKFALLEFERGQGIARITGRKRIRVRLIWDLSRRSVRVPPHPTLQPTLDVLEPMLPAIHRAAIIKQLQFHRVLGY